MKIGILTFHRAFNYGAVLQTLGLVDTLKKEYPDATIEVIDYYNKRVQEVCKSFYMTKGNKIVSFAKAILRYPERQKKKNNFDRFIQDNVPLSLTSFYDELDLKRIENEYDYFITGSDQVWNNVCGNFDKAYFLTFVENRHKKIAYAASFGFKKIPNGLEEEYRQRLENFTKISVREKSGCEILKKLDEKKAVICLDPTLLLHKDQWEKYVQPVKEKEPYIFAYSVLEPNFANELSKIASYTNKKVIYLCDYIRKKQKNVKTIRGISPIEFISYIHNADMVITNSFHGTVFSILFEKEVYVETKTEKYENDRVINLLDSVGIKGREVKKQRWNGLEKNLIDWERVKNNIEIMREESINFIKDSLD